MLAVTYTKYGGPEVLEIVDIPAPVPDDDQVLVQVRAASINAADYRLMRADPGLIRLQAGLRRPTKWPVLGSDFAGVVTAVGRNVRRVDVGDRVFGDSFADGRAAFAEFVCVGAESAVAVPSGTSAVEAASIPLAGITALQAVRDFAEVRSGESVLIHGAGGGVGTMAVQVAKAYGATVTALCGPGSVETVRSCGADEIIDYTTTTPGADGTRYDVILAVNGYRTLSTYRRLLTDDGRYALIGGTGRQLLEALLLARPMFAIGGRSATVVQVADERRQSDLEELSTLLTAGRLRPVVDRTFPMSQVAEAIAYVESGHVPGKVVLTLDPPAGGSGGGSGDRTESW